MSGDQLRMATVEGIVTPEAVVLELDLAGLGSRVFAALLDLMVALGIYIVGAIAVTIGTLGADVSTQRTAQIVLLTFVLVVYPVVAQTVMRGRTVGKRAIGLRAVTLEGAPIRFRHAVLRMMGGLVGLLIPPGGITGMLFILGTRRHQGVGDLLAGTVVIRDPTRTRLPPALWFPVPWGLDGFAATIDPSAMTVEQYTVVRAFLLRNRGLAPGRAPHWPPTSRRGWPRRCTTRRSGKCTRRRSCCAPSPVTNDATSRGMRQLRRPRPRPRRSPSPPGGRGRSLAR